MENEFILKGDTKPGQSLLRSQFWPCQGKRYLVFAHFHDGFYQAFEKYRVIELGSRFSTNELKDKPLEEQVQVIFRDRLNQLKRELEENQAEKQRLEEGLKK